MQKLPLAFLLVLILGTAGRAAANPVQLLSRQSAPSGPVISSGGILNSRPAHLDAEGRYAVFASLATTYGYSDPNQTFDVFVVDRSTGEIRLVTESAVTPGETIGGVPLQISADGRWVLFASSSRNVVPGQIDTPNSSDVFLWDRETGTKILVSRTAASPLAASGSCGYRHTMSADGRYVAFTCNGANLVAGQIDNNGDGDVFLYDRVADTVTLASHAVTSPTQAGSRGSRHPQISADGRFILYPSEAENLVPGQIDSVVRQDLFLWDRLSNTNTLVSHASGSPVTAANGVPYDYVVNADGSWVGFSSLATDMVAGVTEGNTEADLFLFERATGAITLVSRSADVPNRTANDETIVVRLSADGRWIGFQSEATDLVAGQTDMADTEDIFLADRNGGPTRLVSHRAGSATVAVGGEEFTISADGTRVAFESAAVDLAAGQVDTNNWNDIFLYNRLSGSTELVTHLPGAPTTAASNGGFFSGADSLSHDGRVILFTSAAPDLAPGDANVFNSELDGDLFAHVTSDAPAPQDFYTLTPCRLLDTRQPEDGPALTSGATEVFALQGACGVPSTARVLALNVTVVQAAGSGYLTLFPGDALRPTASTITFAPSDARSNNALLALSASGGTLAVYPFVAGGGTVHLILDVVGYFE